MCSEKITYIKLLLKPCWNNGSIEFMDVRIDVEDSCIGRGEELFSLNKSTVKIPFCEIAGGIKVSDSTGGLDYTVTESEAGFVRKASYIAGRSALGALKIEYRILPRVQPEDYASSPYFDFVCEEGGANGAGVTFLPIFSAKPQYKFILDWDLSRMPEGSRGVWCLKEGSVTAVCSGQEICFSYYAVGLLRSIEKENFGFYWFSEPPFPAKEAAEKVQDLFLYMEDFFKDSREPYKVFARRNGFNGHGGTAAKRSYLFGYGKEQAPTVDSLVALFAHEMVHNWPHMKDEPYGVCTWYQEGMAEYYCTVLPYRAGIFTLEETLASLSKKTEDYYSNPTRELSNEEASKIFWTDRRTQRLPYGRGLLYIANVDAQIREASGGKKRVDDVMLEILSKPGAGRNCTNQDWIDIVSRELGRDASKEFNDMASGKLIKPLDGCFGGAFKVTETMYEPVNRITSAVGEKADGPMLKGYKWELSGKKDFFI